MPPRPSSARVRTNLFPLRLDRADGLGLDEYVQYRVEILDARRVKKVDGDGKVIEPYQFEVVPMKPRGNKVSDEEKAEGARMVKLDRGGTALSRRIMDKLRREESERDGTFFFAFDGGSVAVSPRRLFSLEASSAEQVAADQEGKSEPGKYGPADTGGHNAAPAPKAAATRTFPVRVKRECDEDDADADRVKMAWYLVRLSEVAAISQSAVEGIFGSQAKELEEAEHIRQCMDIVLKSAQLSAGMIAFGRSPRVFYFDPDRQRKIANRSNTLRQIMGRNGHEALMVGLRQSVELCENGGVYIQADSAVDFVNRDADNNNEPIPIVDVRSSTIAGVWVDLNRPIVDQRVRDDIKSALERISFHVKYVKEATPAFTERMRERGKSDAEIARMNVIVRRNKSLKKDARNNDASIIWRADDPDLHRFDVQPRRRREEGGENNEEQPEPNWHTVASYFREKKGLALRFPHLPIVFTGDREWFPVEFLSQALGKAKGANKPNHVRDVLSYYDENSGSYSIGNIKDLMGECASLEKHGLRFDHVLRQFGVRRDNEPVEVEARMLPEPKLQFRNEPASIRNGSWDLRNKQFSSPSELLSFAVVSFTPSSPDRFLRTLFNVAERHGMTMPQNVDCLDAASRVAVTGQGRGASDVADGIGRAVEKARSFFLFDRERAFQDNQVWFKSRASNPADGSLSDCLVIPPPPQIQDVVALILRRDEVFQTHVIVNKATEETADARIMALFKEDPNNPVDPFDYYFDTRERCHKVLVGDRWHTGHFLRFVYQIEDGPMVEESEIRAQPDPVHIYNYSTVECPAVVLVYLDDDSKEPYAVSKMATHFIHGVPSQCIVRSKFDKQNNPNKQAQYCSNVCLKLNTKLANKANQARAWDTHFYLGQGQAPASYVPWVHEVPTLVLGLGCSKGIGQDAVTIIGASAALDPGCMHMAQEMKIQQSKASLISPSVLGQIIKSLLVQFKLFRGKWPKRILYYREGLSEGFSKEATDHEKRCIRKACYEILSTAEDFNCPKEEKCQGNGCIFCTPLITFVVCQTNSTVKIVPRDRNDGWKNNVWSGTCVDKTIVNSEKSFDVETDFAPSEKVSLFPDINDSGRDFILTAQGGLKGTSKPIVYSAYPNENMCYRNADGATSLTRELLEEATYHMSFQYGTATKAVRSVPVLYYSKRLAELGIGYVNYLRGRKDAFESRVVSAPADDKSEGEEELTYIRNEMESLGVADEERAALLPSFGPFKGGRWRSPFSTNLSA